MFKILRKEKADLCANCRWYHPQNELCQLKKCGTNNPYVTDRDRKRCRYLEKKEKRND